MPSAAGERASRCARLAVLVAVLTGAALLAGGVVGARAENDDLKPLEQRPALMARSRALSKPVEAPKPQAAPVAVRSPSARVGTDDDSARTADKAGSAR